MKRTLGIVTAAVLLVALTVSANKTVRAWSAGGAHIGPIPIPAQSAPSHHGQLAVRAAQCMLNSKKLFPPGCRADYPVNFPFFQGELERGAQEPDLDLPIGDGVSSSLHSWNSRYSESLDPAIQQAYGFGEFPFIKGGLRAIEWVK